MKRLLIILSTIFLAVTTMTAWAQENPKLSYQAVVRDNQNKLLTNSQVNVEINILKPDLAVQYTETFTAVPTNRNGLMSLLIGNNANWDDVVWNRAKINVKITLPGDMGMVESVSDVSAVPLAISALYADSVNLGAVPQSDWEETNPSKSTFIRNKPNIPDTIKNQLTDGNSVINHIVDTIVDNHIQWATDTLISNRELRDTMNVVRGALADTASVLRGIISTLNTNLQDNIDSTSQHIRSALVDTSVAIRNTINTMNSDLQANIDTTAAKSIARDNALQANIDTTSANVRSALVDTSVAIRTDMNAADAALQNNIDTTSSQIRAAMTQTTNNLQNNIDSTSQHIRDFVTTNYVSSTDLCTKVMNCPEIQTMRDSIQTNNAAIVANATAISDEITNRTAADNEIKDIVKADSTDIMKNVSDTAKAIRALITGAGGDITVLNRKVDSLNTNLFDTLHIKYVTNTVFADTIKDVRDSISALRDSIAKNYVTNDALCDQVMNCGKIQTMRDSIQTNALNIHADSIFFAGRITDLSDSVKMNVTAIIDSSKNIRKEIKDTASTLRGLITDANKDVKALKDSVEHNYVSNTKLNDTLNHYINEVALTDSLITKSGLADTASAIRTFVTTNYVSNADLCDKVMACPDIQTMQTNISTNTTNISTNTSAIAANATKIHNDSIAIMKNVSDTATAVRKLIKTASGDVGELALRVDKFNTHVCDSVKDCVTGWITTAVSAEELARQNSEAQLKTDVENYVKDTLAYYYPKTATYDTTGVRNQIKDTANVLRSLITNANNGVKALKDSVEHNYVSNNDLCDKVMACPDIQKMRDSIQINTQAIIDTAAAIRANYDSLVTNTRTQIANVTESLQDNIDSTSQHVRTALVDTAGSLRDAIDAINTSMCTTIMSCPGITEMQGNISTNTSNIAANATKIAEDSTLFAGRITNLRDSVKMNVQAIIDSSEHIRDEISAATADLSDLETRFKTDSANLANNYYTKTKINDTLSKYSTTAAMDARHYLTSDSTIIKNMNDTLAKHNTRISANYRGIIDTAKAIRESMAETTADLSSLETRFKTDSANLADNYYTKTKINDTLSKYSTTAAMDARHYLTSDSTIIKNMNDTLAKHNTRISANYRGIIDTAAAIRASINAITVNDATLTIQKNGTDVATFTANASSAVTANVNVYDGKLYIKFNGDTLGNFSADQKDTVAVDIKLKQMSTRLILTADTKDTLTYTTAEGMDTTGLVLSIPTGYTQVDTANMLIQLYINGVYVADTKDGSNVVKFINGKLYYYPVYNGNKECKVGDRIQVVYWVK